MIQDPTFDGRLTPVVGKKTGGPWPDERRGPFFCRSSALRQFFPSSPSTFSAVPAIVIFVNGKPWSANW
jgi:hypothetical protein